LGTFKINGNECWQLQGGLQINPSGFFEYAYYVGLYGIISSGEWNDKHNKLLLYSNVQNVNNFPLSINRLKGEKENNTLVLILRNMNWREYNWFCVLDNIDTTKVECDTLTIFSIHDTCCVYFFVESKSHAELRAMGTPATSISVKPVLNTYAMSMPLEVKANSIYSVECDSIFGSHPLHYKVLKNYVLLKKNGKLLFKKSKIWLSPSPNCTDINPIYDE
jgi:hypothetical protein